MNNEAIGDGLQENLNHSNDEQGNNFDYEKGYKNLQPAFDKRNQEFYATVEKLVANNFDEIYNYDKKTQDKVIKKLFGYNSIEEYKIANEGSSNKENNSDEDSKVLKLEAELKLMKYQSEKKEIDNFIKSKNLNTEAFMEEFNSFSDKIPLEERLLKVEKLIKPADGFGLFTSGKVVKPDNNIKTKKEGDDLITSLFKKQFNK